MQGKVHTTADKALDDRFARVNIAEDRLLVHEEQRDRGTALACCCLTIEHNAAAVGKPGGGGGGGRFGGAGAGGGGAEELLAGRLAGASSLLMVNFIISKSCIANVYALVCVSTCKAIDLLMLCKDAVLELVAHVAKCACFSI